ncbi:PREDICTED: G2/mitotic-specific cyclin-A-like, partial [Amphimedon queenslandica]|uniref:Cyclin N-terminal domain-containing protein n=1 Tax=Amphimedon queenslandica TaxID=400682 RepID=A0AAN0J2B1_AMPQE
MANNLVFVPNQENEERRRSLQGPVGVYKRHLKNVPTSESKRKPLSTISLSNHQQYEGTRGQSLSQQTNMESSLPRYLDPLYGLPSSIPPPSLSLSSTLSSSFSSSLSSSFHQPATNNYTSFPSPVSPMLVSTPLVGDSFSFVEPNNDDCSIEYAQDILSHMRQSEIQYHPMIDYMTKQYDITNIMRCILVDWLVEVCDEFHLLPETLFAAVAYVDRYLSQVSVPRSKLQLVGVTCLYLSAKFEEIHPPEISEFAYITDDTYTKKQIVKMEHEILNVLSYNLVQPTSVTFLSYYLKLQHNSISSILKERVEHLSMYLCELALQDGDPFLKYYPSILSASALCLARHCLGLSPWPVQYQYHSGYTVSDISTCIQDLHRTHALAHN